MTEMTADWSVAVTIGDGAMVAGAAMGRVVLPSEMQQILSYV